MSTKSKSIKYRLCGAKNKIDSLLVRIQQSLKSSQSARIEELTKALEDNLAQIKQARCEFECVLLSLDEINREYQYDEQAHSVIGKVTLAKERAVIGRSIIDSILENAAALSPTTNGDDAE